MPPYSPPSINGLTGEGLLHLYLCLLDATTSCDEKIDFVPLNVPMWAPDLPRRFIRPSLPVRVIFAGIAILLAVRVPFLSQGHLPLQHLLSRIQMFYKHFMFNPFLIAALA